MKLRMVIFIVFSLTLCSVTGQNLTFHRPDFQTKTSLVYYYFWEENEDGSISPSGIHTPFSLNRIILIDVEKSSPKCTLSDSVFMREVEHIGRSYKQARLTFKKHKQHQVYFQYHFPGKTTDGCLH